MSREPVDATTQQILNLFTEFRDFLLHEDFDHEMVAELGPDDVYVVVADIIQDETTFTILATLSGESSFYVSDGTGRLDYTRLAEVRNSSIALVKEAGSGLDRMERADLPLPPSSQQVSLYFRTAEGIYIWTGSLPAIYSSGGELGRLMERIIEHLDLLHRTL